METNWNNFKDIEISRIRKISRNLERLLDMIAGIGLAMVAYILTIVIFSL